LRPLFRPTDQVGDQPTQEAGLQPEAADVLQVHEIGASWEFGVPGVNVTVALATQFATPVAFIVAVITPFVTLRVSAYLPMPAGTDAGIDAVPLLAPVYVPFT